MNEKTYQQNELNGFLKQSTGYFDTVREFSDGLETMNIPEQIKWIENGSYGAGACFALQRTENGLTNRTNNRAHIGGTVLHAFYGKAFKAWGKLSERARKKMDSAVAAWLKRPHDYAQKLII